MHGIDEIVEHGPIEIRRRLNDEIRDVLSLVVGIKSDTSTRGAELGLVRLCLPDLPPFNFERGISDALLNKPGYDRLHKMS